MDIFLLMKKTYFLFGVMIVLIAGCLSSDIPSSQNLSQISDPQCQFNQHCATEGNPTIGGGTSLPPTIEIRHLIEPNLSTDLTYSTGTGQSSGGSYLRKLTLPKNFAGRLYLAGINLGSLSSRFVKVRFKFGVNQEAVTIPATVVQAPGITPQTLINVLVMDLRSEPFRNIRLPYDLFDYNEYPLESNGSFASDAEITQDNRNSGLYCRGLRLEDDSSFQGVGACGDQPSEECLYAYAKVLDQGLVKASGSVKVPLTPSFPQIKSISGTNYFYDGMANKLLKPLLDTISTSSANTFGSLRFSDAGPNSIQVVFSDWNAVTILGSQYYYRGPYRLINRINWEFDFPFNQLHGKNKLFRENAWVSYHSYLTDPLPDDSTISPEQNRLYYNSYLFPLATKLNLDANVSHLSSSLPDGIRSEQYLSASGETGWMDGANARAQSRNVNLEHIGSCNVSATIEIIAKDDNNLDYKLSSSKDVKLQLVRATQHQTDSGNEVLYTNFKVCNGNTGCGNSECCFNNRCWDQSLVSQCFDHSSAQGNRIVGESCYSDLECSSLCCNKTTGQCAPHNTINQPAVLCSKPIGDYCISKEWCQKSTVVKCYIIKTGVDTLGNTTCRQQCYNIEEVGDCKNGICIPPVQNITPQFNPDDPNACDNAITAPNF
jgi:hypothetical protein